MAFRRRNAYQLIPKQLPDQPGDCTALAIRLVNLPRPKKDYGLPNNVSRRRNPAVYGRYACKISHA